MLAAHRVMTRRPRGISLCCDPVYYFLGLSLRLLTQHWLSDLVAHLRGWPSSGASLLGLGTTLECLWTPVQGRLGRQGPGGLRFEVGEGSRDETRSRRRGHSFLRNGFFLGPSAHKHRGEQRGKQRLLGSTPSLRAATASVNWKHRGSCCEIQPLCHLRLCGLFTVFTD